MPIVDRKIQAGGLSKAELRGRLGLCGVELNSAAEALFADVRFETSEEATTLDVVELTLEDLGLPRGGTMPEILTAAAAIGLAPCPLELGPHFRLQFQSQEDSGAGAPETGNCAPPGSITVVSWPLAAGAETPKGFYLRRINGRLWLRGFRSGDEHVWAANDRLAFCRASSVARPRGPGVLAARAAQLKGLSS